MKLIMESWRHFLNEEEEKKSKAEEEFEPHMMYDPDTGEGKKTENYEEHVKLKEKGWGHDKPDLNEGEVKKIFYTRGDYGYIGFSDEAGADLDIGLSQMVLDLVGAGRTDFAPDTQVQRMMKAHERGVQGGMSKWDANVFEDYYGADTIKIISQWASMNGVEAEEVVEEPPEDEDDGEYDFESTYSESKKRNKLHEKMKDLVEGWRRYNEGLPAPHKTLDVDSFEGQLLDYLEKNPNGVNVAMLRYAFGGASQSWTRMLQGLMTQGKLQQKGEMYTLSAMGEAKNKDGKEQGADGKACWKGKRYAGQDEDGSDICEPMEEADTLEEEPAKGKAKQKVTASGKKVSYGQAGKAKDGGPRVEPGTNKGDAYCARSMGIKKGLSKDKQNDPNTPNNLSRKRWKCSGEKSTKD
jgi:hypothetical protein